MCVVRLPGRWTRAGQCHFLSVQIPPSSVSISEALKTAQVRARLVTADPSAEFWPHGDIRKQLDICLPMSLSQSSSHELRCFKRSGNRKQPPPCGIFPRTSQYV